LAWLAGAAWVCLAAACAAPEPLPSGGDRAGAPQAVSVADDGSDLARLAPVFVLVGSDDPANRIGTPMARPGTDGEPVIVVDPSRPTVYAERQEVRTGRGEYANLIHRVHFESATGLGAGRNVGLIVIQTLDRDGRLVLVTTVHTCGCYLAVIPTHHLPADHAPEGWNFDERQAVYGQSLPGLLGGPGFDPARARVVVSLAPGTHRVTDVALRDPTDLAPAPAALAPMEALERLPFSGRAVSFFEENGPRKGYVKGSHKPWERLLISWWAFDWRVGEDKALGARERTGTVFYTSLKPWAREASDLWRFPEFLRYWGWRL
jgi:hypothetical protein